MRNEPKRSLPRGQALAVILFFDSTPTLAFAAVFMDVVRSRDGIEVRSNFCELVFIASCRFVYLSIAYLPRKRLVISQTIDFCCYVFIC